MNHLMMLAFRGVHCVEREYHYFVLGLLEMHVCLFERTTERERH